MTLLDDIIDGSTDDSVSTPNLVRKVHTAAHRLGATAVVEWARQELNGFSGDFETPSYRIVPARVSGTFINNMNHSRSQELVTVPRGLEDFWLSELRQPLAELQRLADGTEDLSQKWPDAIAEAYTTGGGWTIPGYWLFTASRVTTRQSIAGILDAVRTRAMEFALELQADFPEAGTVGGPTVAESPELSQAVVHVMNIITGNGTNVAAGNGIQQTSRVQLGDLASLTTAAQALGLSPEHAQEFSNAVQAEGSADGGQVKAFLGRVGSDAVKLAGGIASAVATTELERMAHAFLGF